MSNTLPRVLISNLMMLKERPRFDAEVRALGAEPVWADVNQFLDEAQCLAYAGQIDGWLAGDDRITERVLQAFGPRLHGIAKWGTGIDSIDLAAAKVLKIPVLNTPGAFSDAVAEVALGYMLMLSRHLRVVDKAVRAGQWPKPAGLGLANRTLGILGYGAIGRGVGSRALACKMKVIAHDPPLEKLGSLENVKLVNLENLFREADVICLCCNLTRENTHVVNAKSLALMKPNSLVINVARGPLIDEAALIAALEKGQIAGAGLDVFENEPLGTSSALVAMDNVILGSHNANNLVSAVEHVHANTMANLKRLLQPLLSQN
jgi:D-3-phosphoglycerate dehydrogenase / 2-oxoglutarate reductase